MAKSNRGRFVPGDSRINRAGRPVNGESLTVCLRELAAVPVRRGSPTRAQQLAAVVWRRALAGEYRFCALLLAYLDGRPVPAQPAGSPAAGSIEQYFLDRQPPSIEAFTLRRIQELDGQVSSDDTRKGST